MDLTIVGIDCATVDANVGVALAHSTSGRVQVDEVLCPGKRTTAAIVVDWLRDRNGPTLVAMDAPLGWPAAMGDCLTNHRAGQPIGVAPNEFFRRETDRFIHRALGKIPLDVGADRIARTAHAALRLLGDLRRTLGVPIPLAWSRDGLDGIAAIEVYPAATLLAHCLAYTGYKKADQVEERRRLLESLRAVIALPTNLGACEESADALDAVVCVLAAADFVEGRAMPPDNRDLAEREGWIWAAPRNGTNGQL